MQIPYEKKDAGLGIGFGLFAKAFIPSGTLIWKFIPGVNVKVYDGKAALNRISQFSSKKDAQHWLDMTYGLHGNLNEILDDGRYMNHSLEANCRTRENGDTYSIVDILPGDQLFEDYTTFDHPEFLFGLLEKYDCAPNYYELPERDDKSFNSVANDKVLESN